MSLIFDYLDGFVPGPGHQEGPLVLGPPVVGGGGGGGDGGGRGPLAPGDALHHVVVLPELNL